MSKEPHPGILTILIGDAQCFHRLLLFGWVQTENFPLHITLGPAQPCCPQRPAWVFLLCLLQQAAMGLSSLAPCKHSLQPWERLMQAVLQVQTKRPPCEFGSVIDTLSQHFFIWKWKKKKRERGRNPAMVNVGQYSSAQVSIWKQSSLIAAGCRGQEELTEHTDYAQVDRPLHTSAICT